MNRKTIHKEATKFADEHEFPIPYSGIDGFPIVAKMICMDGFLAGAEWADKTLVEKASEWLMTNAENYTLLRTDRYMVDEMVEDFKKTMML